MEDAALVLCLFDVHQMAGIVCITLISSFDSEYIYIECDTQRQCCVLIESVRLVGN